MELFTLGADRGAYTETDVRELARALTGWRADWSSAEGLHNFRFDATRWDPGNKTVFGATGAFGTGRTPAGWWSTTRSTRRSSSAKLWSYFIPDAAVRPASPARSSSSTSSRATRSAPCSRRSCARPSSTRARA